MINIIIQAIEIQFMKSMQTFTDTVTDNNEKKAVEDMVNLYSQEEVVTKLVDLKGHSHELRRLGN